MKRKLAASIASLLISTSLAWGQNTGVPMGGGGGGTFSGSLSAGQASVGNVGGINKQVCFNPTVTAATYAANVVMGGLFTAANLFTSTGSGIIQSVSLDFMTTAQTVGFKLYFFHGNPSNTTWTEHAAAAINVADAPLVDGFISLANPDSGLSATTTVYSATGLGITYGTASTSGYFILVPTATTVIFGATTSMFNLCVTVLQNS